MFRACVYAACFISKTVLFFESSVQRYTFDILGELDAGTSNWRKRHSAWSAWTWNDWQLHRTSYCKRDRRPRHRRLRRGKSVAPPLKKVCGSQWPRVWACHFNLNCSVRSSEDAICQYLYVWIWISALHIATWNAVDPSEHTMCDRRTNSKIQH